MAPWEGAWLGLEDVLEDVGSAGRRGFAGLTGPQLSQGEGAAGEGWGGPRGGIPAAFAGIRGFSRQLLTRKDALAALVWRLPSPRLRSTHVHNNGCGWRSTA